MNTDIEVVEDLIEAIQESIEFLEAKDPDNAGIDELKLLLSDDLSKEGTFYIKPSLPNIKNPSLFFKLCRLFRKV